MKTATLLATLFSTLALAGPIKRAVVTVWDIETKTVTVHATHSTKFHWSPAESQAVTISTEIAHATLHTNAQTTSNTAIQSAIPPASTSGLSSVSAAGGVHLSDYATPILNQHNIHRSNHSAPSLQWDDQLTEWAKQIAETCVYGHSRSAGDGDYGQNIGAGAPNSDIPKMITDEMYNGEIIHYPGYGVEPDMGHFESWGHFSQIVWKETQKVGCYTAKCTTLKNVGANVAPYFTVCNYSPAGNSGGQYAGNVLAPLGNAPVIL